MSTQNGTLGVAQRLRSLRGEESQEAFSQRVGLTRSALANYETGRTIPKPSVLRQIAQRLGVSENLLIDGIARDHIELLASLGIQDEAASLPGLTADEKAIVRILRVCDAEVVNEVVAVITSSLEARRFARDLADPATVVEDIARLFQILDSKGVYERGITPDTLSQITSFLAKARK